MKICNLADGLGQLTHAITDLNQQWAETQQQWNDETSRQFEEAYLRPIPSQMQTLITAVQALSATVDKAVRELIDREEER
ncbi:MAG: WXG100 family type VII secretion target [Planctomycetia bacterium]|jgi:uncharacterized protein YukE|nr:WXG100 family type VII secretion target [Planctomycetia bacterium]